MPHKLSIPNALQITQEMDKVASIVEGYHVALGIPPKHAKEFAERCDHLSELVESTAGIRRLASGQFQDPRVAKLAASMEKKAEMDPKTNYTETDIQNWEFDPAHVGEEQAKAVLINKDEPYMNAFKQDEFDQLREVQQDGMFSNAVATASLTKKMARLLEQHNIPFPKVIR